jgi:MFS family permease
VALLGAVEMLPFILFTLPAGAWLDRVRRRPVLIAGDLGRGVALLTIPIAYALRRPDDLAALRGRFRDRLLTVLFDVADQSYLPALLDPETSSRATPSSRSPPRPPRSSALDSAAD